MRHRISPSTLIASAALFFSLGGTGLAASRYLVTSKSQIKPSVLRELHGDRGRTGRTGRTGAAGATGATGAAGPAGVIVAPATAASDPVSLSDSAPSSVADVYCPTGDVVIGGGYLASGAIVEEDQATAANQWTVSATLTPGSNSGSFTAQAVCVPLAG